MTDVQLYLAIGIPTFAVLIGILMNVVHHSSTNARFNGVETRLSTLESRIDARFNAVDSRFTRIEAKLNIG